MRRISLGLLTIASISAPAFAQLAPGPNPLTTIVNSQQTLTGGTGTIASSGGIVIASGGTVPLLISGTSTLINNGQIVTNGSGRAIDSNSGIANLTITNNGSIRSVSTDAFRVNTNSAVNLTNNGEISVSNGGQAIDWAAISSATNILTNNQTGIIRATGEDAVRPGANGRVINYGDIRATPTLSAGAVSGSDGIDLRTLSGINVSNYGQIVGRHGIATDGSNAGPSLFTLDNHGIITALNGSGLNIDGVSTTVVANVFNEGDIRGGVMTGALEGDGDGVDVDGILHLENLGTIAGQGAIGGANNAEGIAAGGGTIINRQGGRILGTTLVGEALGDATRAGNGILIDDSNGGSALAATSIQNAGTIDGRSGFAIRLIGNQADTLINEGSGYIRGTSASAAVQMGDGDDVVTNQGWIFSETGNAVDLEGGNDRMVVEGFSAQVTGNVSGGSGSNVLVLTPGDGGQFVYDGVLSNFDSVEVQSGQVTLRGANAYTGVTLLSGGVLTLEGADRINTASNLVVSGATIELLRSLGVGGQTFASLSLQGSATFDLGTSQLTFGSLAAYVAGATLTVIDWDAAAAPGYAFRFLGDLGSSADFLALLANTTIDGYAATYTFDGTYTNVSAVPLPGALVLLASGLGLLARRRQRQP